MISRKSSATPLVDLDPLSCLLIDDPIVSSSAVLRLFPFLGKVYMVWVLSRTKEIEP